MPMGAWITPPRHLLVFFFAVTLVPAAGLVWLGWRLLEQDRQLEAQREMERREYAADRIVGVLQQQLSSVRQGLTDPAALSDLATEDSVALVLHPDDVTVYPDCGLLYRPVVPQKPEAPNGPFLAAERLEFQKRDYERAIEALRKLARSEDAPVRAGAWLRLARNYRKAADTQRALAAYEELAHLDEIRIEGVPAALRARFARCSLLAELGRSEDLQNEAAVLSRDLFSARWQITGPVFRLYASEVGRWVDCPSGADARLSLSGVVDWFWGRWTDARTDGAELPESMIRIGGNRAFTILARQTGDQATALVAGPNLVCHRWFSAITPILEDQDVEFELRDTAGSVLLGTPPSPESPLSLRLPADTGLPWTVVVSSRNTSLDGAAFNSRRRLLMSALGLVMVLVLASGYYVVRSVSRELAAARLKSDFVSAVSHEFRTPLATLRQLTENLADGRVADEERRRAYFDAQFRATARLSRLVERLLDFGRMEAGAFRYHPEPIALGELVRTVVDEFEHVAATTGHRIELTIEPDLPSVFADREALAQAVWNLLDNAIKYSPGRPAVWIEVAREDGGVAIRVRDEGPGLPAEERKDLFRKFVRGSAARETGVKGTGIGLAMVDYIVRAHHGRIVVDSRPGEGSTFTILLKSEEA
jgi:signal transduction histidine kinase